ncbi:hypothetical protein PTKIN_Ptkin12aG0143900 [Pterospermum kingtungense]
MSIEDQLEDFSLPRDEEEVIELDDGDVQTSTERMEMCLVGRFLTDRVFCNELDLKRVVEGPWMFDTYVLIFQRLFYGTIPSLIHNCLQDYGGAAMIRFCSNLALPSEGFLNCNVDAFVVEGQNGIGIGIVLRSDSGKFSCSNLIPHNGPFEVKEAEALGVYQGINWVHSLGFKKVLFKTDAKMVVDALGSNR